MGRALAWILLATGAAVFLVAAWLVQPGAGDPGTYHVAIIGPEGPIWSGNVTLSAGGHALDALDAAARAGGFSYDVVRNEGIRPCPLYVSSIAGHTEEGAYGWVYQIRRDDAWLRPQVGACGWPMEEGDQVRWMWGTP